MTVSFIFVFFLLCEFSLVSAHVVLVHPTPRTDNDYLYTFDDGICNPENTCPAFCGDAYDVSTNPVTILQVGVPITLRWKTTVVHEPLQYRLSLNPTATDVHFDLGDNILATVANSDAADPSNVGLTGSFSTNVIIPESALDTCSEAGGNKPCVLQLWDIYYFVSCANVLLTTVDVEDGEDSPDLTTLAPLPENLNSTIFFQGASFEDYRVTMGMERLGLDPILTLERCRNYTFVVDARGHPFVIKTKPGLGLDNVLANDRDYSVSSTFPTDGMEQGNFTFWAGDSAPSSGIFYQCTLHIGMVSEIFLVDGGACDSTICPMFCALDSEPWSVKCNDFANCSGCSECDDLKNASIGPTNFPTTSPSTITIDSLAPSGTDLEPLIFPTDAENVAPTTSTVSTAPIIPSGSPSHFPTPASNNILAGMPSSKPSEKLVANPSQLQTTNDSTAENSDEADITEVPPLTTSAAFIATIFYGLLVTVFVCTATLQ